MLELSKIKIDGGTQQRAELNQATVYEYAEAYRNGANMPAITVFFDGAEYWLADGFHRLFGAKEAGKTEIEATVINGTVRDAIRYSLAANSKHGLRRTNADKRKAVMTMLEDGEWSTWSSVAIAQSCNVSRQFVDLVRKESPVNIAGENSNERTYVNKHGQESKMDISGMNKKGKDDEEDVPPPPTRDDEISTLSTEVVMLAEENESLKDRLSLLGAPDDAQRETLETIDELRAEIKRLEIENRALAVSRDSLMAENAELKRQCSMQRKQLQKMGK